MRVSRLVCAVVVVAGMVMSAGVRAESKNPADYPLRLHIFGQSETSFYHGRDEAGVKGDGRADLYEGGEARGVDFSYECGYKLRNSFGYETYPAKWKKPGRELVVLLPMIGRSGEFFTCHFNTDVKDFAYARGKNGMHSEPVAEFKEWMVRHDYDPEHGKDVPVKAAAGEPGAGPEGSGAAPPAGTAAPQL